jgi:Protein of unknown function (DUF3309)
VRRFGDHRDRILHEKNTAFAMRESSALVLQSYAATAFSVSTHQRLENPMLLIMIILLVLALGGGGWGHSRYGYASWSPAGLIVVVLLVLLLTGNRLF